MRLHIAVLVTFGMLCASAYASQPYSKIFSSGFKAAVDQAMEQPTGAGRTRLLIAAMAKGTDDEVFFVFPLLFPLRVINGAQRAHVCVPEIQASLANGQAFVATSGAEAHKFPTTHSKKIRADTNNLIRCLDQYYANGQLRLPPSLSSSN